MKTKMLLIAALLGAAAMSANAGVRFRFFGLPLPVFFPPPVVCAAPVLPAPVAVVQTVAPCPSVDYVAAPGYWPYYAPAPVWAPGGWSYRPAHAGYGHYYGGHRR